MTASYIAEVGILLWLCCLRLMRVAIQLHVEGQNYSLNDNLNVVKNDIIHTEGGIIRLGENFNVYRSHPQTSKT